MSVQELQALITKLSVEIDLQKEVLQQLERSKSAAQRQLNGIHDPVARLPLEISSEIFVQCLPPGHLKLNAHSARAPMLLLNVCSTWSDIALSTPALWTAIHLGFPRVQMLELWFQRARHHPLAVDLHRSFNYDIAATLGRFTTQLKHLEIRQVRFDSNIKPLRGLMEFPRLEKLAITPEMDHTNHYWSFSLAETVHFLRLAPNLVEFTFPVIHTGQEPNAEIVVLPCLRFLALGEPDVRRLKDDDKILKFLSLPALDTLFLSFLRISTTDFSAFLQRSAPPLRRLLLGAGCGRLSIGALAECLRFVPTLMHLELYAKGHVQFMDDLFSALEDSPSTFLPNLQILRVQHDCSILEPLYQKILRALSVRRIQLRCVRLRNQDQGQLEPGPGVCAGLRELIEGGMDVWIGTAEDNFILV
ncbi:hypothetical protein K438DRAFT_1717105 [Mycena galopus ATCC 62051]|nr:hypothetical protein K438DRAFT_1717105 [Mycena galopus ATCC 62051]